MDTGDVGQFTEGRRGMLHSEWNHGTADTRAYILVYTTDPVPEATAFGVLRHADAPRYEEDGGARTKELVGPRSPLLVNGDIRLFTDSRLDPGSPLRLELAEGEGGVASVREGAVRIDEDERLSPGETLVVPPGEQPRTVVLVAQQPSRVVRVVHGPGHGFIRAARPSRP
jgi:redox-sensitive bicupin YhaK (pirin superfamily)